MHAISSAWYGRLPGWSANFAEMITLVQVHLSGTRAGTPMLRVGILIALIYDAHATEASL